MLRFLLFTDGGGFPKPDGRKFDSASSIRVFITVNEICKSELIFSEEYVNPDTTNNFAEIFAIRKALDFIVDKTQESDQKAEVCVYTDSMLYYNSLKSWIYAWIKRARKGILYSSKNEPVINQGEIISAFKIMQSLLKHNKPVQFFHINSHNKSKGKTLSWEKQKEKFEKFNKCELSDDDFLFLLLQNKKCDESVKTAYNKFVLKSN